MRPSDSEPSQQRRLSLASSIIMIICILVCVWFFVPPHSLQATDNAPASRSANLVNTHPGQACSISSPSSENSDLVYLSGSLDIPSAAPKVNVYKLIGWNDLGMHCMNENFSNLAVLPPFNTLWAQLIRQGAKPQIITTTVRIEYALVDNTFSACQNGRCKSNFWQNAQAIFGLAQPLPDNVGLTGSTLAGNMNAAGNHFIIEGVPVTPYRDSAPAYTPANWYPYQQVHMVAKDAATGAVLADTMTVAPVSTEMRCELCHADGLEPGGHTGNVETNILTFHDREEGTNLMGQRPVLCASCHASNALGAPGDPRWPNLSRAMHHKHGEESNMDCYYCHPGQVTRCLRDIMWSQGLTCVTCHGSMNQVANVNRRPWIDLPRCDNCHAAQFAENPNTRYRDSVGHGGLYCEACHGSPHAILPTIQANDNIQNIALQGHSGILKECWVCHGSLPTGTGPHGIRLADLILFLPHIEK
jgi:hypothetical protein